jgi:diguanylate cyclase (GGDEF)-like protein
MFNPAFWRTALEQLTQAIHNHEQWYKNVTRTILCQLPYDQRDVAEAPHRQCRFGQWYYSRDSIPFHHYAAFVAIDAEHARMHQLAALLLRASANKASISLDDYDMFTNSVDRLRLQLDTLRREIEDLLFRCDPLTGAESRVDMLIDLRQMLEMVKRRVQQCSIAMMDLDHFKVINDSYGHLVGDRVLKVSVDYVKSHMRPYDKVFRYGGEEFLISMPNTSRDAGEALVERIRKGLATTAVAYEGVAHIFVTASFGVALLDPDVTIEESIDRADKALYAAKRAGRNCVRIWESSSAT